MLFIFIAITILILNINNFSFQHNNFNDFKESQDIIQEIVSKSDENVDIYSDLDNKSEDENIIPENIEEVNTEQNVVEENKENNEIENITEVQNVPETSYEVNEVIETPAKIENQPIIVQETPVVETPVTSAPVIEEKVENVVEEKQEVQQQPVIEQSNPLSECEKGNHSIACGNSGMWFNSKAEAIADYDTKVKYYGKKWENYEITDEEYDKNCPYGYEIFDCMYCGKWTINYYYRVK